MTRTPSIRPLPTWRATAALLLALGALAPLRAAPLSATLIAERACPATVAIRHDANPGAIHLDPGTRYPVVGANRPDQPSHYLLRLQGAEPSQRWVAHDCGRLVEVADTATPPVPTGEPRYLLAVSWQPAFCERRGRAPECRDQTPQRFDARAFSLHGLWPQPRDNVYCDVPAKARALSRDGDWQRLPALALAPDTRRELDRVMPGTRSALHRHEWVKHGSCYGDDPEGYFADSLRLLAALNASPVRDLFVSRIGQHLRASEVRAAFDRAFGKGAGERVQLVCHDGLISELRLALKGPIEAGHGLDALLRAAPPRAAGCKGGRVDRAGRD
ncbi:ribonuclease T(2) [Marichromatium gracile]|uniref:ribonuclease T2 family protein n=1 Tax=Marichromatium gracile TaxID=1048 RepID=UPI001F34BB3F|nr:ribonuclease T(2) [Marichromatium gracile]MCF1184492.1 ribonuclease T(2) [Marichromatium gracile]